MIKFLIKGILRDKSRSILPIIIIAIGVSLTVFLSGYLKGVMNDLIEQTGNFETGHVKITTKAYLNEKDQLPNDLALMGVGKLKKDLKSKFPEYTWVDRIKFGGLIDAPDKNGNSKGQGPSAGIAINFFDKNNGEIDRLNIEKSLISGHLISKPGEVLLGEDFAKKLKLKLGDEITYFGTTMNGSMTFYSFKVAGTIKFGVAAMDKGAVLVDINDARKMLDMDDASGEILGFLPSQPYDNEHAIATEKVFNNTYLNSKDEFTPVMQALKNQNNLAEMINFTDSMSAFFVFIFVSAMSVVLWNTGLIGGLRRYKEFGIRLALGESKGAIYLNLIVEAVIIGLIGSIIGTIIGLGCTYYLQKVGIDIGEYMKGSTMMMPSIVRAKVSPSLFYIGFIPGLLAMVIGTMLSGYGIYKRQTSQLFKDLEI